MDTDGNLYSKVTYINEKTGVIGKSLFTLDKIQNIEWQAILYTPYINCLYVNLIILIYNSTKVIIR